MTWWWFRRRRRRRDRRADPALTQNAAGAVPSPSDLYLVLRGVKTLGVRMDRHCENARAIVDLLSGHRAVERASALPANSRPPRHAAAAKQMRDYGGMVSFTLHGGEAAARRVAAATELGCTTPP
ncbi:MAG: PLP-dependent transferase [Ilumatobacteraceae bacterium]